jgi:hypothetical protein
MGVAAAVVVLDPLGRDAEGQERREGRRNRHGGDQPDRPSERRDDLLGDHLEVEGVADAQAGRAEEQQDRQRGANVREHERVHRRAHVIAAHVEREPGQPPTREAGLARRSAITVEA